LLICSAIAVPDTIIVFADLFDGAFGYGAVGKALGDGLLVFIACVLIAVFDQEPIRLARSRISGVHANKCTPAMKLLAVEVEFQMSGSEAFVGVFKRFPGAEVPHHDRAATILAFGNSAFKIAVFDGVVFDLNGKTFVGGEIARAFRNGPAFEDAIPGETEIVVKMRCCVFLNDERKFARLRSRTDCGS